MPADKGVLHGLGDGTLLVLGILARHFVGLGQAGTAEEFHEVIGNVAFETAMAAVAAVDYNEVGRRETLGLGAIIKIDPEEAEVVPQTLDRSAVTPSSKSSDLKGSGALAGLSGWNGEATSK